MRPKRVERAATSLLLIAPTRSRRSAPRARAPRRRAPAASSCRRSSERAASTRRQPAARARRAVAAPIPDEAPVISSTRSSPFVPARSSLAPFVAGRVRRDIADRRARGAGCHDGPMLHDRARIHVQAGAGGDGCIELPPRSARAARRSRRRRRRARRRCGGGLRRVAARPADLPPAQPLPRRPRRPRRGLAAPRRGRARRSTLRVPPGTQLEGEPERAGRGARRPPLGAARGRPARDARARRARRQGQQALRHAHAPGAALRRARPARARRAGSRCS